MHTLAICESGSKRPAPPSRWLNGRRVDVGSVVRNGSGWTWQRNVLRHRTPRRQAHWIEIRGGWSLSCALWAQVRVWVDVVEFLDELGGRWTIPAARLEVVKRALDLPNLEEPHWLIPAECWDYAVPRDRSQQLALGLEAAAHG